LQWRRVSGNALTKDHRSGGKKKTRRLGGKRSVFFLPSLFVVVAASIYHHHHPDGGPAIKGKQQTSMPSIHPKRLVPSPSTSSSPLKPPSFTSP